MHNSTQFLYGWKMLASCTTQHKYKQCLQSPPLRKKNELPCHFLWQPIQCSPYLSHGKILGLKYFVYVQGFEIMSKNFNCLNSFKLF